MIYLLTAIGLSPGGRSTVHIYTQTIYRLIRNKQYIHLCQIFHFPPSYFLFSLFLHHISPPYYISRQLSFPVSYLNILSLLFSFFNVLLLSTMPFVPQAITRTRWSDMPRWVHSAQNTTIQCYTAVSSETDGMKMAGASPLNWHHSSDLFSSLASSVCFGSFLATTPFPPLRLKHPWDQPITHHH